MNQQSDILSTDRDPYRVLYLLPSAPQDLVIEVYWNLVSGLLGEPDAPRLRELNGAYELILKGLGARPLTEGDTKADRKAARRKNMRAVRKSTPAPSPVELLHVTAAAPPGVVDLAYRYWQMILRQRVDADARLDELHLAYGALQQQQRAALTDGAVPFEDPTAQAIAEQHLQEPPHPLASGQPETHGSAIDAASSAQPGAARRGVGLLARGSRAALSASTSAFHAAGSLMSRAGAARGDSSTPERRGRLHVIPSERKAGEPKSLNLGPDPKIEERFSNLAPHDSKRKRLPRSDNSA